MSRDLYAYIQQLHQTIQTQNMRITELEKKLHSMNKEMVNLKNRPPVHVDTIEYKFDQLKVESLDGVLNIGLNPGQLEGIENFEVQNQHQLNQGYLTPSQKMEATMKLEDSLYQYLETDFKPIIGEWENQTGRQVNEDISLFIKEDIKKQLPQRINDYLKKFQPNERTDEAIHAMLDNVEEQMKADIKSAVFTFLNRLPHS